MNISTLLIENDDASWVALLAAPGLEATKDLFNEIVAANGVIKQGKKEVSVKTVMVIDSNHGFIKRKLFY